MNREQMIARSGKSHLERLFAGALWDAGWRYAKEPDHARGFFGEVEFAWDPPEENGLDAPPRWRSEVERLQLRTAKRRGR